MRTILSAAVISTLSAASAFAQTGAPSTSPGGSTASSAGTNNASRSPATASAGKSAGGTQGAACVSGGDRKFMEKAAQHGMAEVQMGQLAQQKAASQQVKDFAGRMVADHTKANGELKSLASARGLQLPTQPDGDHQKKMAKMQDKSGAEFDKAYMKDMVDDHKKDVSEFRKQAKSAKDPELKAFASKTLPTLEEHLKIAQDTEKSVRHASSASPGKTASSAMGGSTAPSSSGSTAATASASPNASTSKSGNTTSIR